MTGENHQHAQKHVATAHGLIREYVRHHNMVAQIVKVMQQRLKIVQ